MPRRRGAEAEVRPADAAEPDGQARPVDLRPLPTLIGYALRRTQVAVFNAFRRTFAELGLRPAQLGILTVVGNNPGLKQAEVSAALGIKRANLVPLLDGLTGRGLIERGRVASDRRSHALRLTAAGEALLADAQAREAAFEAEIAAGIGEPGRRRLIELLRGVEAACGPGEDGEAD